LSLGLDAGHGLARSEGDLLTQPQIPARGLRLLGHGDIPNLRPCACRLAAQQRNPDVDQGAVESLSRRQRRGKQLEGVAGVVRPLRREIRFRCLQRKIVALRAATLVGQSLVHLRCASQVPLAGKRRGLVGGRSRALRNADAARED
jgi:hypothetical protein